MISVASTREVEQRARELERLAGPGRVWIGAPLGPLTSFGIGGPADLLVEAGERGALEGVVARAREWALPLTLLGGGSNVLVSDAGIRGLVLRVRGGRCEPLDASRVRADAGVSLNGLVRWSIHNGAAGLAEWAGTPGTVGGALYGNAHFQGRLIGERLVAAELLARDGRTERVEAASLELGYDRSRLQRTGELALSVELAVTPGNPAALRAQARESLLYRKRTQPLAMRSAGCAFQNPDPAKQPLPPGMPASAGALIDAAGLKGERRGGARISPVHANFIVNEGGATAADVLALMRLCRERVAARFGVVLEEEIVVLGESGQGED